jgi:hypothetical protein
VADVEHLEILRQGATVWNDWRRKRPSIFPDLRDADLTYAQLAGTDLSNADLVNANLSFANLRSADLSIVSLDWANLNETDLTNTNLYGAMFIRASFVRCLLDGAVFTQALMAYTTLVELDLHNTVGLETILHTAASDISISTIYKSAGNIPEAFLLGCGVPKSFIAQIPNLVAAMQPIQFDSCFISYSCKDEEFARRLHARMREAGLRVWFTPEDIQGGRKLYEQIDRAIHVHDRLLLVLSKESIKSEWVMTEIRRARKAEVKEGRRKLFPIRLVGYESVKDWECFDADTGKDLAVEVREYFIPDFSTWKNPQDFEKAFEHLYADLKASAD